VVVGRAVLLAGVAIALGGALTTLVVMHTAAHKKLRERPAVEAPKDAAAIADPLLPGKTLWPNAFPIRRKTQTFVCASSVDFDVKSFDAIAEEAWTRSTELLNIRHTCPKLAFIVCRDAPELVRLETLLELPAADETRRRDRLCPGGFYRDVPMIAITYVHGQRWLGIVAHEVCHWAVYQVTHSCPPAIGEGLCEWVRHEVLAQHPDIDDLGLQESEWVIRDPLLGPVLWRAPPDVQVRVMAERAAEWEPDDLILRQLVELRRKNFGPRQYALSWCLALVLVDVERERPGSMRRLLSDYAKGGGAWTTFASIYDERRVERLWFDRIDRIATSWTSSAKGVHR
jgi:hypothetical protein